MTPPTTSTHASNIWVPELPPTDLVFDDGVSLESNRHCLAMNVLIDSVYAALKPREDFYAGGNMFVYYSLAQIKNRDFRGAGFFCSVECGRQKGALGLGHLGGRWQISRCDCGVNVTFDRNG
jgi:hypothetical protein